MVKKLTQDIINLLPIKGDKLIDIKDGLAVYQSGGKMPIGNTTGLIVGDIVTNVYLEIETNAKESIIFINIDHQKGNNIFDNRYEKDYLKIIRRCKLIEIFDDVNDLET